MFLEEHWILKWRKEEGWVTECDVEMTSGGAY